MPELQKRAFENFAAIDGILVENLARQGNLCQEEKIAKKKVENDFLGNLLLRQQSVSRSAFR